jgi:putative membrane protein
MFIDYLTLMLINLAAGLFIMAVFVFWFLNGDRKKVAPGLLVSGFVALVTGLHEIFTWPIVSSYNIPFGEMSVFFGVLFFATGIAILRDWDLLSLGVYAVFAGAASIVLGIRIYVLKMTSEPLVAMAGFVLTGLLAVLALPAYVLRKSLVVRILAALGLVGASAIWAFLGYLAYWAHLANFAKWVPAFMQAAPK